MSAHHASLSALNRLHRTYDGPVPEPLRRAALLGSAEHAALIGAEGNRRFYKEFVRRQVDNIRRRRAEGSCRPHHLTDLLFYRDGWRRYHRFALELRAALAAAPALAAE
jgi:hypothetical protein